MKTMLYLFLVLLNINTLFAVDYEKYLSDVTLNLNPHSEQEQQKKDLVTKPVKIRSSVLNESNITKVNEKSDENSTKLLTYISSLTKELILPSILKIGELFSKTEAIKVEVSQKDENQDVEEFQTEPLAILEPTESNETNQTLTDLDEGVSVESNESFLEANENHNFFKETPIVEKQSYAYEREENFDAFVTPEVDREVLNKAYMSPVSVVSGEVVASEKDKSLLKESESFDGSFESFASSAESTEENTTQTENNLSEVIEQLRVNEDGTVTIKGRASFSDRLTVAFKDYEIISLVIENEDGTFTLTSKYVHDNLDFSYVIEDAEGNQSETIEVTLQSWYVKEKSRHKEKFKLLSESLLLGKAFSSIAVNKEEISQNLNIEYKEDENSSSIEIRHEALGENRAECEDVNYIAYLEVSEAYGVKTGFKLDGLNCENQQDPTDDTEIFSVNTTQAKLLATTPEEKELYGQSPVVIVVDYELNDDFIIVGN